MNEGSPTSALAHFVAEFGTDDLPEEVVHEAKRALLDHIGVTIAGAGDDVAKRSRVAFTGNDGAATVIGCEMTAAPASAAFLNAFASHVLDMDDVYNPPGTTVHGSCSVWPAILALAETRTVTGRAALTTFALGFEVETRVAHAAGPTHYDAGWHVTGTSGHVGAAAAAARTLGMNGAAVESAVAAGATQAAGLRAMAGSDLKSMHPAKAAMDGVIAAMLVEQGLGSSRGVLECDFGYLAVMSADPAPERISAHLGETWNLLSNGYKLYPSGSLTHPMIDGVVDLITADDVIPDNVSALAIRVSPPAARFTDLHRPTTRMQAKFSLRHCAAAAVVFRRVGTAELEESVLTRPDLVHLRDRVQVVADPALGKQEADVEIVLTDGRILTAQVRGNRGTPTAPLDDADLSEKFRALVGPMLGSRRTGELLRSCWQADESGDVSTLLMQTRP